MAKFYGVVGFVRHVETTPGVWNEEVTELKYPGDVVRNLRRWTNGNGANDDVGVNVNISIIADAYANRHMAEIRYVNWNGEHWKVSDVDASQPPRLALVLGGVYNGQNGPSSPVA